MAEEGLLEVDQIEEAPAAAPQPEKAKAPHEDEIVRLRAELKQERRSRGEFQKAAEFWSAKAQTSPSGPTAKETVTEPEPKVTVDLVDALTNNDHKAIAKAMREMGFVSAAEVQSAIASTRSQITQESRLLQQYPDLSDDSSDFFKRTGEIYNELSSDPAMAKSGKLVEVAARMAKAELGGGGTTRRSSRAADFAPEHDDEEEERAARVSRQSGDRGRNPSRQGNQEDHEELSPMQKTIVARLRAAGANITEEGYAKRAKMGIRMSGLPSSRRPK